jgi:hypothetical protein
MSKAIDRLIAIRTMQAVESQVDPDPQRPPTRWERWKAAVRRLERKLL